MEHSSLHAEVLLDPPPPPHLQQPSPPPTAAATTSNDDEGVDTVADLISGWLGGAVGVLVGNPFEVLKVRLQTAAANPHSHSSHSPASTSSPRVGKSSVPPLPYPAFPTSHPSVAVCAPPVTTVSSTLPHSAPPPTTSSTTTTAKATPSTQPKAPLGIMSLYRTEGLRFFFAGTAGPILGLAFIDSAFFGLYGRVMQSLGQDRQDPNALSRVFLSGATAGAMCALLETPIEVVKTRAQVEGGDSKNGGKKLGSFKIASQIARTEGLRGFYVGGLMTATHDGIASGIFFWGYFVFRRLLRGESPFYSSSSSLPSSSSSSPLESLASPLPASAPSPIASASASASASIPDVPQELEPQKEGTGGGLGKGEVGRIMLAGGLAGALSAIVPYPFDIVKTRLQTANFESRTRSSAPSSSSSSTPQPPKMTVRSVFRAIHTDGLAAYRYRYPSTWVYQALSTVLPGPAVTAHTRRSTGALNPRAEKWAMRVLGFKGFATGLGPTVVSSFVGSAATITTVELALHFMGVNGGGGVG